MKNQANQLQIFENREFGKIRVVEKDGQPWFVGKDICDVFGDSHYRRSISALDDDEKGVTQMDTPGGRQSMAIVSESGLYSLLFMMKPSKARGVSKEYVAEREAKLRGFRRWVTHEVLPSIRKHGAYISEAVLEEMAKSQEYTERLISKLAAERLANNALYKCVGELAPKARYYDVILQCDNAVLASVIAKDYGLTAVAFNKLLHDLKIQFKLGSTWLLYKRYMGKGYTLSRTYHVNDNLAVVHTLWTQAGRRFLYEMLKWHGILPEAEAHCLVGR